MGQTLTHGVYLPDEGERNCYAGLAANWQILDNSVGTIAEHTSALSEKAPLVHTHTVSQITDFPAYGNAAGTICEGNDSRLSDARTPVAHTHGKADITDLFNSVNVWNAQQKIIGNNSRGSISIYNPAYTKGSALSSTDLSLGTIYLGDGGQQGLANSICFISSDLADNGARSLLSLSTMENTASSTRRTNIVIQYDKNDAENPRKMTIGATVFPNPDATFSLGTSTNKWKTLNGINPGALSLPDYDSAAKLNLTSTLPAPNSNNLILYTPTMSGWLYVYFDVTNATTSADYFFAEIKDAAMDNANAAQVFWRSKPAGDLPVFFPVIANKQFRIEINFTGHTVKKALLIPSMGHVA